MSTAPLPTPTAPNPALRTQLFIELFCFLLGSALYLGFWRHRPHYVDMTFGLLGMSLIFLRAWRTRLQIWGPPLPEPAQRLRASLFAMALCTLPVLLGFAIMGWLQLHAQESGAETLPHRFFRTNFWLSLPFYFLYAGLQQALFQFYLLGRLKVLAPRASIWTLAIVNGALYALMHLAAAPDLVLLLLTFGGGIVWTVAYNRWRCLLPVTLSHMLLGVTYFYWVRDIDKMKELLAVFGK